MRAGRAPRPHGTGPGTKVDQAGILVDVFAGAAFGRGVIGLERHVEDPGDQHHGEDDVQAWRSESRMLHRIPKTTA